MQNYFNKIFSSIFTLAAITSMNAPLVQAQTLDWINFWDCGSTERVRTISNYAGTGVDVTIEYSSNSASSLKLYQKQGEPQICSSTHQHELWTYHGVLRTTAAWNAEPTYVKVTFSEPVYVDDIWLGNLSFRPNRNWYEWMELSAYSSDNVDLNNVSASNPYLVTASAVAHYEDFFGVTCPYSTFAEDSYGNDCNLMTDHPDFVEIIDDGSQVYKFRGMGVDTLDQRGRVFAAYQDTPVQTLLIGTYVTDATTGDKDGSSSSAAISPTISFTPSGSPPVTPPTLPPVTPPVTNPPSIIYAD